MQLGNIKGDGNYRYGLVSDLPSPGVDGDLGLLFMRDYDIDFDFANRKFNIFSKDHCEGGVVYWTKDPVAVIPVESQIFSGVYIAKISVEIDGKSIDAWIDTSQPRSFIDWNRAKLMFGFDENSPGVEAVQAGGMGGTLYRYPFKSLTFGTVTINNPKIDMLPADVSGLAKDNPMMYIGADVLHLLHLYVANGEHKLYVTPASAH